MPFKDPEKRREYAKKYYSSASQKSKKKKYDRERYLRTSAKYKQSRSRHSYPHRYIFDGVWVCAECGATDNLVIHHINGVHGDNNQSNLACLCAGCHSRLHINSRDRSSTGRVLPVVTTN